MTLSPEREAEIREFVLLGSGGDLFYRSAIAPIVDELLAELDRVRTLGNQLAVWVPQCDCEMQRPGSSCSICDALAAWREAVPDAR